MPRDTIDLSPTAPASAPVVIAVPDNQSEEDAALGPLIRKLSADGGTLIRQEVSLAALEVQRSAITIAKESAIIALGGFFIATGLVVLLVFVILALGRLLNGAYWLSTLIIGSLLVGGGMLALYTGRKAIRRNELKPRRTIESLRETKDWAARNATRIKR